MMADSVRLAVERQLAAADIETLYPGYVSACEPLRTRAAARHVLDAEEFRAEMTDSRVEKFVVRDRDEMPVGLTTITNDPSAIPWISSQFYSTRYPDVFARGVLFYLGYIVVVKTHRRSGAFRLMTEHVNRRLSESKGVLAFDFCGYNDTQGIGRFAHKLLPLSGQIDALDVQSYYSADFRDEAEPS